MFLPLECLGEDPRSLESGYAVPIWGMDYLRNLACGDAVRRRSCWSSEICDSSGQSTVAFSKG